MGTDLVFGSVPGVGSRAGDGRVGGPGGRAGSGLRPPGTRGWAWVPAGSGLDLVPCSGLSVSLALLGKVWVLGLGRGAACGGRRCPGREALRQASGSAEVAEGQATKGSSGGGGGRTNFLIGYRAGRSHRGEQGAPQSPAPRSSKMGNLVLQFPYFFKVPWKGNQKGPVQKTYIFSWAKWRHLVSYFNCYCQAFT